MDLFSIRNDLTPQGSVPLAERLRPQNLSDFFGQDREIGPKSPLLSFLNRKELPNLILWGPPGSGKTTFAHIVAGHLDAEFISFNAIDLGTKELRSIGEQARFRKLQSGGKTLFFLDEVHRLNKSQQDILLPFMEKGDFTLIGATTENPSYELNAALLSRSRVVVFEPHSSASLQKILKRACQTCGLDPNSLFTPESQEMFFNMARGDARQLLNMLEQLVAATSENPVQLPLSAEALAEILNAAPIRYDKSRDEHYDLASALIKSIRGSDPNAGVYYLARMLEGGEDPIFIARRLVILASEDVGNADPKALPLAIAGLQAVELIGLPEAAINLSQVVTYLACAPKSNRSYQALRSAQAEVKRSGALPVPLALRSAQTRLAQNLGYGKDYKYSHDGAKGYIPQDFLPHSIRDQQFYSPSNRGFEKNISQYLSWMKNQDPKGTQGDNTEGES